MKIKNILLIILSLLFLIILFYTFYRSEVYHEGTIRKFYLKYYLIAGIFLILAIFVKNIKNLKIVKYVFFSTVFLFSSVYIIQISIIFKNDVKENNKK